jgi:hypothetical protein
MKTCGIYRIINVINHKIYIGQSTNISERFIRHRYQLNSNSHCNIKLQNAWNKYGSESFKFEILIKCKKSSLKRLEKQEVKKIPKNKRYNISKNYDNLYGKNNPFYGKTHTKNIKKKLSFLAKKRIGNQNPNYGNKYSIQARIKAGHNKKTKLTKRQVKKIVNIKNQTHQEIANKYGVSRTIISRIKNGKRWGLITNINGEKI